MRTHYQNLKVAEDAPPEVIKAAWRALSNQYHPDRNQDDPRAVQYSQIINDAYAVLSDPVRRRAHDLEIRKHRGEPVHASTAAKAASSHELRPDTNRGHVVFDYVRAHPLLTIVVAIYLLLVVAHVIAPNSRSTDRRIATRSPAKAPVIPPPYVRSALTPSGQPWPKVSGYLPLSPVLATGGECEVVVDNSQRSGDVHVKLMQHAFDRVEKVRECFIRGREWLKMPGVRGGQYEVRYMDLNTGQAAKSEIFKLEQTATSATTLTLTLYLVPNGNTHLQPLAPSEF